MVPVKPLSSEAYANLIRLRKKSRAVSYFMPLADNRDKARLE